MKVSKMARKPDKVKEKVPARALGWDKLRDAGKNYEKVDYVGADGKKKSARVSGDAVSVALVGATREDLVKVAKANKLGAEVVAKVEAATNVGLARMSLSNRLRAIVRKGETPVTVRGVEITSLDQKVEAPAPKKTRAVKKAA
jgi:hypothetical protein